MNAVIVFVLDIVDPETVAEQMQCWGSRIRERLSQLIATKSNAEDALRQHAVQQREAWRRAAHLTSVQHLGKSLTQPTVDASSPELPLDRIYPLPSIILLNKMDALEVVCQGAPEVPGVCISLSQYTVQWGRKYALLSAGAFVALSGRALTAASARGLLAYCLLLAAVGHNNAMDPTTNNNNQKIDAHSVADDEDAATSGLPISAAFTTVTEAFHSESKGEDLVADYALNATQLGGITTFLPRGADRLSNLLVNDAITLGSVFQGRTGDSAVAMPASPVAAGSSNAELEAETYGDLVESVRRLAEVEMEKKEALVWTTF